MLIKLGEPLITCVYDCVLGHYILWEFVNILKSGEWELLHTNALVIHPTLKLDSCKILGQFISNDLN